MAFRKIFLAATMAYLGLWSGSGNAQEGNPGERLLEEERRRREIEELTSSGGGQVVTVPEVQGPVDERPCFPIEEIALKGVTVLPPGGLDPILAEFRGRCLGQTGIGNLLARISAAYADRGYITTRAYVPAQDIGDRRLEIEVLEGRIEAFIYQQVDKDGKARPGKPRKIRGAFPIQPGDVLHLRDVEHGLEQINRLPSSSANANLVAGQAPGTSQIVVTEQKINPIRGTFGLDNRGNDASGRTQIKFGIEADDLLNFNDRWSLSYAGTKNSNAMAYAVSVPFRRWSFSTDGSYSEELLPISQAADLFTQTTNINLTAERIMYRNARSKYFMYGTTSSYWNRRYINVVPLTPQHRTAFRVGLRHEHRLERTILAVDTSLSFGAKILGSDWIDPSSAADGPRADFRKIETRVTFVRPFENGRQFMMSATGQYSNEALYSNEQMSVGGWESVRGYSGYSFSGDAGLYVRSELSFATTALDISHWGKAWPMAPLWDPLANAKGGVRPFAFFDAGYVRSSLRDSASTMLGAGFGVSAQLGGTVLTGALAVPMVDQNGQESGNIQAFMGLSVKLF